MAIDPGPQLQHRRLIEKIAVLLFLAIPAGCSPSFEYAPPPRSLEWIERYGYVEAEIIDFAFGDQGLWVPIVEARINDQPVR